MKWLCSEAAQRCHSMFSYRHVTHRRVLCVLTRSALNNRARAYGALKSKTDFDTCDRTVDDVQAEIFSGKVTCRQVVEAYIARIVKHNPKINAIISLNPRALDVADELDASLASGRHTGLLFGVPILLKDNFDTTEMRTTGACLALAESQPTEEAPTVTALKKAGAVILGKASMHELALEGLSVSSLGGQVINPFSAARTPGGSSGGSGAAVAASFAVLATGTDTFNSLRSPASANSLFSCRPTRGLVTRTGIMPNSYTQDAAGPIARTAKDVATALTVMASVGFDAGDKTTALIPDTSVGLNYAASLTDGSLEGVRLGLVESFQNRAASDETTPVNDAMTNMVSVLRDAGATVVSVNDPSLYSAASLAALDTQLYEYHEEMDAYLQRSTLQGVHPMSLAQLLDGGEFLVIPAQRSYIAATQRLSSADSSYAAIQLRIQALALAVHETFRTLRLDALIYPQQRNLVVRIGSPSQSGRNGILAALTGFPVVTIPAGFSACSAEAPIGVPIGMEILGRPWTEARLLQIAHEIERRTRIRRAPPCATEPVASRRLDSVPSVVPNRGNIAAVYPVGKA